MDTDTPMATDPRQFKSDEYNELRQAMDDEDEIMKKVEEILETTPDKEEAERIVKEKYLPLIEQAMKKTKGALQELRKAESEELKMIEKEMNDLVEEEEEES